MLPTSLERLDMGELRQRLGNDEALIADVLRLFLEDCPARLGAIESAVAARRLDAVRRGAHTLKGSAGTLSAVGVAEAAATLEDIAARNDVASLDHQCATLAVEVERLVAELRGLSPADI